MISKITSISFVLGLSVLITACNPAATTPETPMPETPSTTTEVNMGAVETSMPADNMEVFSSSYTDYQADEAEGQQHVLFFHADWCPTCVKWDQKIKDNMADLADDAVIYKVNYDTADELKAQYGVTKQSQAVFVNADGSIEYAEADPSIDTINAFFNGESMQTDILEIEEEEDEEMETFGANYLDYDISEADGQRHVLFFYADWCPTCVKWEGTVKAEMDSLNEDVLILKADYDTAEELKAQYEVTQQSTAVFIDENGTVIKSEMDPSIDSINAFFVQE